VPFFYHKSNRGRPGIELVPPRSRILYEKIYIYIYIYTCFSFDMKAFVGF